MASGNPAEIDIIGLLPHVPARDLPPTGTFPHLVCYGDGGQSEAALVQGQPDRASIPVDNVLQGSPLVLYSHAMSCKQRDWLTVRTSAMASNTASCPSFLGVSPQYMMITSAMMIGLDS